jgi:hypothetical protein
MESPLLAADPLDIPKCNAGDIHVSCISNRLGCCIVAPSFLKKPNRLDDSWREINLEEPDTRAESLERLHQRCASI